MADYVKPGICQTCALLLLLIVGTSCASAAAPVTEGDAYNQNLATLYNEYQRVLAMRDACIIAQPLKRNEYAGAYQDWLGRHENIVDDLDNRFAAMVKRASRNQADYSRNYGKYQSEIFRMREENKKALLADRKNLAVQCGAFAAYLRHPRSDIPVLYPAEFKNVFGSK